MDRQLPVHARLRALCELKVGRYAKAEKRHKSGRLYPLPLWPWE
jgi:hypothetical protein